MDSNHRRHSQQIYSLSPLAARELSHVLSLIKMELVDGFRTPDLLITNQLLYRLSYTSNLMLVKYSTATNFCQEIF